MPQTHCQPPTHTSGSDTLDSLLSVEGPEGKRHVLCRKQRPLQEAARVRVREAAGGSLASVSHLFEFEASPGSSGRHSLEAVTACSSVKDVPCAVGIMSPKMSLS